METLTHLAEAFLALVVLGKVLVAYQLHTITKGIRHMADAQAQALADLSAAVDSVSTVITDAAAQIAALIAAAANVQPDDSAAIEVQVKRLTDAAAVLKAPPATPPVDVPAAA